jgi:hypothetical protein
MREFTDSVSEIRWMQREGGGRGCIGGADMIGDLMTKEDVLPTKLLTRCEQDVKIVSLSDDPNSEHTLKALARERGDLQQTLTNSISHDVCPPNTGSNEIPPKRGRLLRPDDTP